MNSEKVRGLVWAIKSWELSPVADRLRRFEPIRATGKDRQNSPYGIWGSMGTIAADEVVSGEYGPPGQ